MPIRYLDPETLDALYALFENETAVPETAESDFENLRSDATITYPERFQYDDAAVPNDETADDLNGPAE